MPIGRATAVRCAQVWDPLLIIAQIISIQCLFYLGLGLWQTIFFGPYVGNLNVQHIFGWKHMSFHSYLGWMTMAANVINAPLGAVYLLWIVGPPQQCGDVAVPACMASARVRAARRPHTARQG